MRTQWHGAALLVAGLLAVGGAVEAQEYVVMGTPHINLRTGPGTEFAIIGMAEKGDLFWVAGETDGWWEIRMFSGDTRWVSKAARVYPLTSAEIVPGHRLRLPESEEECRSMRRSIQMGFERAQREAEELLPAQVDGPRHDVLRHVFEDRILLEMFHIFGMQPAVFDQLMAP